MYKSSDIIILPSYREGIPKSLIEACAIGRPIITTNAIGCRDCVDHMVNGLKVDLHSNIDLANALIYLIDNENASINEICNFIKGPDFPTDAEIITPEDEIKQTYKNLSSWIYSEHAK